MLNGIARRGAIRGRARAPRGVHCDVGLKFLPLLLAMTLAGILPATVAGGGAAVQAVLRAPQVVREVPGPLGRTATPAVPAPHWSLPAQAPGRAGAQRDRTPGPGLPGSVHRANHRTIEATRPASLAPRRVDDARVRRQPESRPPPDEPIAA